MGFLLGGIFAGGIFVGGILVRWDFFRWDFCQVGFLPGGIFAGGIIVRWDFGKWDFGSGIQAVGFCRWELVTESFITMNCNANANFSIPNKPSFGEVVVHMCNTTTPSFNKIG